MERRKYTAGQVAKAAQIEATHHPSSILNELTELFGVIQINSYHNLILDTFEDGAYRDRLLNELEAELPKILQTAITQYNYIQTTDRK